MNSWKKLVEKIDEIQSGNATEAVVYCYYKDDPSTMLERVVRLRDYNEDPDDEDVFFYFSDYNDMFNAFNPKDDNYDFVITGVKEHDGIIPAYDKNGLEIKRGDFVITPEGDRGLVFGEPSSKCVSVICGNQSCIYKPHACEIDHDCVRVYVSDIDWGAGAQEGKTYPSSYIAQMDELFKGEVQKGFKSKLRSVIEGVLHEKFGVWVNDFFYSVVDRRVR